MRKMKSITVAVTLFHLFLLGSCELSVNESGYLGGKVYKFETTQSNERYTITRYMIFKNSSSGVLYEEQYDTKKSQLSSSGTTRAAHFSYSYADKKGKGTFDADFTGIYIKAKEKEEEFDFSVSDDGKTVTLMAIFPAGSNDVDPINAGATDIVFILE